MLRLTSILLLFAVAFTGSGFAQTPTWKAELLSPPPVSLSLVATVAVNDAGQVVGNGYLSGYRRAWIVGPDDALQLLPLPAGATYGQAYDINSSGVVAGSVLLDGTVSRGVLWQPDTAGYDVFLLPSGPGGFFPFDAQGINDLGDVVGKYGILGGSYHWNQATGVTQLTRVMFPKVPSEVNEQRQIIGGSYRMDLDTLVLEDLGNPTGTTYNYVYTDFTSLNDAGECAGYAVVATSLPPYLPVRYSDGPTWRLFNSFPWTSASVLGLAASGDTAFQLGAAYGMWVFVEGFGSIALQNTLDPAYADWDLTNTYSVVMSRGGLLACTGSNGVTGESGVLLLTPLAFEDLGGAAPGALGDPVLSGYGSLVSGSPARLRLASAAPNSRGLYFVSATSAPIPLFGGVLHANPTLLRLAFQTDTLGRTDMFFNWPSTPSGTTLYVQALVFDSDAAGPVSLSNALKAVTQ